MKIGAIVLIVVLVMMLGFSAAASPDIYKIAKLEMNTMQVMMSCIQDMVKNGGPQAQAIYQKHYKEIDASLDELDKATK